MKPTAGPSAGLRRGAALLRRLLPSEGRRHSQSDTPRSARLDEGVATGTAIRLRPYRPGDAPALHDIFHRAVHEGARSLYSPAERLAWSPSSTPPPWWERRLADQITLVAQQKRPVGHHRGPADARLGFMTLGHDGHLDFAYVLPERHGSGIATLLHEEMLRIARAKGLQRLDTEASLIGRGFFLKQGWVEQARILHRFGDETLSAMRMVLPL